MKSDDISPASIPGGTLASVAVRVTRDDDGTVVFDNTGVDGGVELGSGRNAFPGTVAVVASSADDARALHVYVTAKLSDRSELLRRESVIRFTAHQRVNVYQYLSAACLNRTVPCPLTTTCGRGGLCEPIDRPLTEDRPLDAGGGLDGATSWNDGNGADRDDVVEPGDGGEAGMCVASGQACVQGLSTCCGGATCNTPDGGTRGTCACSAQFATCASSEGCCGGLTCRMGRCLMAGCFAPGERCDNTDAGTCCGGYACNVQPSGQSTCSRGPALSESDPPTTCMTGAECAGSVLCTGGVCVCRRGGQSCSYSNDCCGAMLCVRPGDAGAPSIGTCQCQASGNGCRIGGNDCCSGACRSTPTGDRCP